MKKTVAAVTRHDEFPGLRVSVQASRDTAPCGPRTGVAPQSARRGCASKSLFAFFTVTDSHRQPDV
jgi:hypothetical protein